MIYSWWYAEGPGTFRFYAGTGKWDGICGEGKLLGMLLDRKDDWLMLNWEFWWRIDR
ncbi:MAG: hypothetical protein ABSG73_09020 [Candidatus Aminicenantales bacterium]|jgi:hypothetical protein